MMLTVETWPLDKIIPYDKNAKLHHVEWIAQSISEFKIDQPIVVDGQGVIIKGHGRLKAAQSLGLTEFPVVVRTDLTPEQIRLARIADNRSAEGGWDSALLGAELNDLLNALPEYDFDSLGLTEDWFSTLHLDALTEKEYDDDALEQVPEIDDSAVITQPGDLWQLGKHRLLCGDSTSETDVARLMNGENVELLFTSPPYADMREYDGNDLCIDTLKRFISAFYPYCAYQVVNLGLKRQNNEIVEYWQAYIQEAKQAGYKFLSWNIWNREQMGGSVANMSAMFPIEHEWIFIFGKTPKEINRTRKNKTPGFHYNIGNRQSNGNITHRDCVIVQKMGKIGTIQTIDFERKSIHPAQFPTALPQEYVEAMTNENDIVVDSFGGSGTTLIACESLGRQSRLMEISPRYCDLIVKRWETLTGNHAVLL